MIDWNTTDFNKTFIVDIDDTISTHNNRDYVNAKPHYDIIRKLNNLYDSGFNIIYFTARGALSSNGNIQDIEKNCRAIVEDWMTVHNVKYTYLLFGKPLGLYYIDDKALRPDEFMKMDIEALAGGSGADIKRIGDRVVKVCDNIKLQCDWYGIVSESFPDMHIPKIHSMIYNTLTMEYIDGKLLPECDYDAILLKLDIIFNDISKFQSFDTNDVAFETYLERVEGHINIADADEFKNIARKFLSLLLKYAKFYNTQKSFCHGDLTAENIIVKDDVVVYIDPNYDPKCYSSWMLDVAKMYQSFHQSYEYIFTKKRFLVYDESIYDEIKHRNHKYHFYTLLLEASHWVRMYKYKNEHDRMNIIKILKTLYEESIDEESKIYSNTLK